MSQGTTQIADMFKQENGGGYKPTEWQLEDLEFLLSKKEPEWSANWSEMGCYKTTTGLWLVDRKLDRTANPDVLVITTKPGKGTYFDAIPKTMDGWVVFNIHATGKAEMMLGDKFVPVDINKVFDMAIGFPCFYIANYHCFTNRSKVLPLFRKKKWDMIILDEAHRIKERTTQWTRNIKRLRATHKHIMTGTGFINRPDEIWSLLNFLNRQIFSSYHKFKEVFCEVEEYSGFEVVKGIKPEMKEQFQKMVYTIGVRRERNGPRGVFNGYLHPPTVSEYTVELNPIQKRMYAEIKALLQTLDEKGEPIMSPNVLSQLHRLRQICVATPEKVEDYYDPVLDRRVQKIKLVEPSSKLDAVMDILDGMEWDEDKKQQVVIFSNFKDPLKLLQARFDAINAVDERQGDPPTYPYLRMTAEMSEEVRYRLWHDIWPKQEHRIFLSTLSLGSESINLVPAYTAVFLDRSWSPKDNEQGISRIYRPPQTEVPHIIHIHARGTVDQYVKGVNTLKQGWFNEVFREIYEEEEYPEIEALTNRPKHPYRSVKSNNLAPKVSYAKV